MEQLETETGEDRNKCKNQRVNAKKVSRQSKRIKYEQQKKRVANKHCISQIKREE